MAEFTETQIQPVSLPDAAAIEYAGGDVRHLSPEDPLDSVSIANATRNLAWRDNVLADKVNELVSVVNNTENLAPLIAPLAYISQGQALVTANYRIPAGFEARVVDAAVSSQPPTQVLLEVLQSTNTYGQTTGTSICSTYGEFTAGTSFYPAGELILRLTNAGTAGAMATASVLVSLRPVAPQAGAIIGPGAQGQQGQQGPPGPPGVPGVGLPGPPGITGLNWRGVYNPASQYAPKDGVSYDFGPGVGVSSFICLLACTGVPPPTPSAAPSTYWGILAYATPDTPDSVFATFHAGGTISLGQAFGYFVAPYAGQATAATVFVQTPPVGGSVTFDLINSGGLFQGRPISATNGLSVAGTTFVTPLQLTAGQTLQAKVSNITGSLAGNNVTYQLWYEALGT